MHLPSRRCTCAAKDSIPRPSWARSAHHPIPSLVICELLGVPYADCASFQHRTTRLIDLSTPLDERLALGTLALLTHPDQLAVMRDDQDAGAAGVEELLRYLSIVHTVMLRQTTTEVEAAGVHIPAGRLVVLSLPSGNRDPAFIDDPDTLDISRGVPGHLAFGHGYTTALVRGSRGWRCASRCRRFYAGSPIWRSPSLSPRRGSALFSWSTVWPRYR